MLIMFLFAGGFVCGGPEQPLHCFLQRVPCGGAEILKKGMLWSQDGHTSSIG